ncbi:GNAT family N-acetyltransferase [Streptacidiphilus fuscans]|uniref:GNAT family N-acetyltransferase n=1 Tax=Streptacidiphilus fuscans TaxID=2789292 RepID=A0A931FHP9_9ACTN|nr:GNAT family N-acetyltransferase [Streptacidiphilus fuscans]MBF9073863.1 GNAT family N-acetyltransferase [Streptacidiphilus fuscans]
MRTLTVRTAAENDLAQVVRVRVDSWRAAYAGLVPPAYLDGLDPGAALPRMKEYLAALPDRDHFLVVEAALGAEDSAQVVGFVLAGPERPSVEVAGGRRGGFGEVYALYVHPDAWFTGAGAGLLAAATEALAADGYAELTLWVLEENHQARRFYERHGWRPDGGRTDLQLAGAVLQELRYSLTVSVGAGAGVSVPQPRAGV